LTLPHRLATASEKRDEHGGTETMYQRALLPSRPHSVVLFLLLAALKALWPGWLR